MRFLGNAGLWIDYILIRKSDRKQIRDVKVIRHEECISGHKLIICVLDLKEGLNKRKMEFVKRCKVWKLRDDVTAGISKSECGPGAIYKKTYARYPS